MGNERVRGRSRGRLGLAAILATVWFLLLLSVSFSLHAAPPPDADPSLSPWFNSLKQPGSGVSCCSIADCRPVDYRTVSNHYEVFIGGDWLPVPPDKIVTRGDNPTGQAVVCWTKSTGILCFVRAPES